ncbi:MAG: hypothetical protein QNJ30_08360 [Kiloniellales bacterium]|nr:hypothetical protein [Kiloniellales bacterium]
MTADRQQDDAFRHPGDAALRRKMDRSRQLRSEALGRGASVFVGYIRSQAKRETQPEDGQETWQPDFPPTVA